MYQAAASSLMATPSMAIRNDPFRATHIWNEVVNEFKQKVPQITGDSYGDYSYFGDDKSINSSSSNGSNDGRRKHFSGAAAVETLVQFLSEQRDKLGFKDITAEKAIKLCQIWMNDNLIVSTNNKKLFEPTEKAHYYFGDSTSSCGGRNVGLETPVDRRLCVTPESCRNKRVPSMANLSNAKSYAEDISEIDEQLLYDLALFRLLTLVEIPILDGIMRIRDDGSTSGAPLPLEKLFATLKIGGRRNRPSPASSVGDLTVPEVTFPDLWVQESYNVCCVFGGIDKNMILHKAQPREWWFQKATDSCKQFIAKNGPLIPKACDDVLRQIGYLLHVSNSAGALEATQYLGLLLSTERRLRLGSVLHFLCTVSRQQYPPLSPKYSNAVFSQATFLEHILPSQTLSEEERHKLLSFMVHSCGDVLKFPRGFREEVLSRQLRIQYTVADPEPVLSYCQRISSTEYYTQKYTMTEDELVKLFKSIVDHATLSGDKKIEMLQRYRSEYPEIYEKHFQ